MNSHNYYMFVVQAFYQEYWVNLTLIATKVNSTDFVSLLCPQRQKKVLRNPHGGTV